MLSFPPPFLPLPLLPSSLLLAPSVARRLIAMNLNCCIHSPALAAVKKQQQKPETNGVLIFSRSCQSYPFPLSLLRSLRHCATRQPWRVPVSRDGYTAFWDKRRLGTCIKYEACRPNGLPVCVCVCATPPCTCVSGNCWLCLPTVYQKMKQKSNGSAKSSSRKICEFVCVLQL